MDSEGKNTDVHSLNTTKRSEGKKKKERKEKETRIEKKKGFSHTNVNTKLFTFFLVHAYMHACVYAHVLLDLPVNRKDP